MAKSATKPKPKATPAARGTRAKAQIDSLCERLPTLLGRDDPDLIAAIKK